MTTGASLALAVLATMGVDPSGATREQPKLQDVAPIGAIPVSQPVARDGRLPGGGAPPHDTTLASATSNPLACAPGVTARLWAGGDTTTLRGVAAGTAAAVRGIPRDTVITLAIADRTWSRDSVHLGVALGASGVSGTGGARWRACAGATTHLGRATARLRNVYGTVRLHVSPGALETIGRAAPLTPPAAPPRR